MTELGHEVVPIGTGDASASSLRLAAWRHAGDRSVSRMRSATANDLRTRAVVAALRRRTPFDLVLCVGSETYDLSRVRGVGHPTVAYADASLRQMWRHPDSDIRGLGLRESDVLPWFERQGAAVRGVDACCVTTRWAAESFASDYRVPADRINVVGMGHRPRRPAHHRDWDNPRFLFVGLDWHRKNGPAVVRAFARVRESHPTARLDVVGRHPRLDLPGVHGHGELLRSVRTDQQALDELFAAATAFVLPSLFEPAGIAYLEAASCGLPVIATREGGAAELLPGAAQAVPPRDQDALTAAMLQLCDAQTARRLGRAAQERAAENSWDAVCSRILDSSLRREVGP